MTDITPPDLLNLAVEVLDSGALRITWYTSEESTESIEVDGQTFVGDTVALRKNHDLTVVPDPRLTAQQAYTLIVTVADASGNTNTSSIEFSIEEDTSPSSDGSSDDDANVDSCTSADGKDCPSGDEGLSQQVVLAIALFVALLVLAAIIRTRRSEQEILAETFAVFDDTLDDD